MFYFEFFVLTQKIVKSIQSLGDQLNTMRGFVHIMDRVTSLRMFKQYINCDVGYSISDDEKRTDRYRALATRILHERIQLRYLRQEKEKNRSNESKNW